MALAITGFARADGEAASAAVHPANNDRRPLPIRTTTDANEQIKLMRVRQRLADRRRRDIAYVPAAAKQERTLDFALDGNGVKAQQITLCTELEAEPEATLADYLYVQNEEASGDGGLKWKSRPISALGVDIALPTDGPLPPVTKDPGQNRFAPLCQCVDCPRPWGSLSYCFAATCLCYNPLYFEEINLERYGYGCHDCLQPAVSAAHFFGRIPCLPCMMLRDPPCECDYTLGHYRPGSCNPWRPVGVCRL